MHTPMELAIERARRTMNEGIGGPFGAAIVLIVLSRLSGVIRVTSLLV